MPSHFGFSIRNISISKAVKYGAKELAKVLKDRGVDSIPEAFKDEEVVSVTIKGVPKSAIYIDKEGNAHLNLVLFANKEERYGKTHMLKFGVEKEFQEKINGLEDSDEKFKWNVVSPILGNAKPLGGGGNKPANTTDSKPFEGGEDDELPF